MNSVVKKQILGKIQEYDKIVLVRHIRPDGDAIGSTKGLCEIIRSTYPSKDVRVVNSDRSENLEFLGGEDSAAPEFYGDALVIAIDTATKDRISNADYSRGRELIKIDHHIDVDRYGDISWVEPNRSSSCEMICDFWYTFKDELKMTPEAARLIYTGMVTDSGRFRYDSVSRETLRLAGELLDFGIDTETIFSHLYLSDFNEIKLRAQISKLIGMTENGVAYIYLSQKDQKKFGLSSEQASDAIINIESIKGSICWMVLIENSDRKSIRVRLRSRFMSINKLAEKYHGGGHAKASGATVYSKKEMNELLRDADKLVAEYKHNNDGWI